MIEANDFYDYKDFNGWLYGTSNSDFMHKDIFIMTPPAVKEMSKEIRDSSFVIYLDIPTSIRRERLANRNDADDTKRRLLADFEMFYKFDDYDLRITNENF